MNDSIKNSTPIIEQVVSVRVSSNLNYGRYSDGESWLKEHLFTEVREVSDEPGSIEGTAPNNGPVSFVLLEQVQGVKSTYPLYTIYRIERETKHIIDSLDVRFAPDSRPNGEKEYAGNGEKLPNWVIVTRPAPLDILQKAALFAGDRLTVRTIEVMPQIEADANTYSLAGRIEPITRLKERNPLFVQFIHDYGNNDFSVTAVADTVAAYMKSKETLTVSAFTRKFKETNEGVFQQLLAVGRLHTELKPLLNVTLTEEREGKERLGLSVAAHIAKIPLEQQCRAWEKIKKLPTHDKRFTAIKKIRKQIEQDGTF